LSPWTA